MIIKSPTNKKLAALAPAAKRYSVAIGFGLSLKVQTSGLKSWVLRLCSNGRVSDVLLGHFPEMTLAEARQASRRKRKAIGAELPAGYTLKDAFRLWCNLKRGRIVSYAAERKRLERYIIQPLGNKQVDEVTAPLVIQAVRSIEDAGHRATLKRILMRLREMLDLAVCAGYIQHNPVDRLSRVFAPPITTPMPAVAWQELPNIMQIMRSAPKSVRLLFLWSLCSMLRPVENASLRKTWILDDVLTLPAEAMKKRRPHRLPLTRFMKALLAEIQESSRHPRSDFIFPGRLSGTHISSQTLTKYLHGTELAGRLVAHGLRSIARSWMADNGVAFEVGEACLSHVTGSQVSRAYLRSDYLDARRSATERWNAYIFRCAHEGGLLAEFPRLQQVASGTASNALGASHADKAGGASAPELNVCGPT